ncbi:Universal stress protein [Desulfosarcina cetonica]|uniref:universal stress protein n=1 Tax=Desulfosarcina cetonica TaxID=90730 RepID=UPI0009F9173E|nr:universal stress protein [Desulfosarcina cetonica]VTR64274.1 Universal stress protein [Desulfosarcina cetonica]
MFKHILLPTDGSNLSEIVVEKGIHLAQSINARITGISVVLNDFGYESDISLNFRLESEERNKIRAEGYLSAMKQMAQGAGVICDVVLEVGDQPYEAIVDTAEKMDCDLIMMASHGRKGIGALLLGSETQKVLTHSKIPVLVYR